MVADDSHDDNDIVIDPDDEHLDLDDINDNENRSTGITNPRESDVLCGRGGAALRHPGNQTYRRLVNVNKAIREQNGRFLEKDNNADSENRGTWYDIGDKKAIEKTSQALREGQPKLRQQIAELNTSSQQQHQQQQQHLLANTLNGLPPDINPHSLPYGVIKQHQSSNVSGVGNGLNGFGGSVHTIGSIQSVGSGGSFSYGGSALDLASLHSASHSIVSGNAASVAGSTGMLHLPPPLPPFLQQQQQQQQQQQNQHGMGFGVGGGGTGTGTGGGRSNATQYQEFQVQRMQTSENPHHRDIPLNLIGQHGDGLPQQQQQQQTEYNLQNLSVHSGTNLSVAPSSIHGGMTMSSVRTFESNAVNTVNTFNSMNTLNTMNSLGNNTATSSSNMAAANLQQRLALARELGIEESQVSLLSELSPNPNLMMNNSNFHAGSNNSVGHNTNSRNDADNYKRTINGLSLADGSYLNVDSNTANMLNNDTMMMMMASNTTNTTTAAISDNSDVAFCNGLINMSSSTPNSKNSTGGPSLFFNNNNNNNNANHQHVGNGISHINVLDINQSLTSCVTNHSAFNNMSTTNNNNNNNNNTMQGGGVNPPYQQLLHQQQQQQQLLQQQQQQQQQHLLLLQQQQRLQQQEQPQPVQYLGNNAQNTLNQNNTTTVSSDMNSILHNNYRKKSSIATSSNITNPCVGIGGTGVGTGTGTGTGAFTIMDSSTSNNSNNGFDRRHVFANMKYVRPPSAREQPEISPVGMKHGPVRHPIQQLNKQQLQQQQHRPQQQPEVTTIKISDGIHGRNKGTLGTNNNNPGKNDTSESSLGDLQDLSMGGSIKSLGSSMGYSVGMASESEIEVGSNAVKVSVGGGRHNTTATATTATTNTPTPIAITKNQVIVETAKIVDHSAGHQSRMNTDPLGGSRHSIMSGMSGLSITSIFSDLSKKIGNVSTRSLAMSEMSSVDDQLDMEEQDEEDDDDCHGPNNNNDNNHDDDDDDDDDEDVGSRRSVNHMHDYHDDDNNNINNNHQHHHDVEKFTTNDKECDNFNNSNNERHRHQPAMMTRLVGGQVGQV